ncbi:beta-N-acetylhexosaminidase [Macrococcus psychrotolerans]|uniref:Beta-N-acetylhexosaminidase n=1 Tax=Macrococcus psychrotolerans TaxID=3039389 RepID=A0AAT9P5E5_9STAP|nr:MULTISPECIES: beta-N-acetylhexosaminidase [Macrococcus]QYA32144.1 beta-N-acetylhexosaminidase [Macrococcus sp. 19Msa1099]QYA36949.1 beta-N-acetylhexosaminidase [Macrococcus caseolyticus]QYA75657.1 beta-N-acetylhexosaminidase [Macrococcus caseolyticus]
MKHNHFILILLIPVFLILTACNNHKIAKVQHPIVEIQKLSHVDLTTYYASSMTLEEKIAQQLVLGFNGTDYNAALKRYSARKIGGVILFKRNIVNESQVTQLNRDIFHNATDIPMFIGIDQEGGRVNRLPASIKNIESAYTIGLSHDKQYAYQQGRYIGENVKRMGFNLDFAPVLDIWSNPVNKVIGDRSFGHDANTVSDMSRSFRRGINDSGIITSGKHFPGHGDTVADSHVTLPVSNKSLDELMKFELLPFKRHIDDGIDMIMVSHISFPSIDSNYPASISKEIVTNILKKRLGYKGVIISDDLNMGAISNRYSLNEAVVRGLQSGETIMLIGSDAVDVDTLIQYVKSNVENGNIDKKIIDENNEKIIRLKLKYGIL